MQKQKICSTVKEPKNSLDSIITNKVKYWSIENQQRESKNNAV